MNGRKSGLILATLTLVCLAGCSSTAPPAGATRVPRPNLTPAAYPPRYSGPAITVTYFQGSPTAPTLGGCPEGYVPAGPGIYDSSRDRECVYDQYNVSPVVARIGTAYPFRLGPLHCGLAPIQFDHAIFIPAEWGATVPTASGLGTMTLTDATHARYVDINGAVIPFVAVASVRTPGCE